MFDIGDRVVVRSWDDLASEFEATASSIGCRFGFNRKMEIELSGRKGTIRKKNGPHIWIDFDDEKQTRNWSISTDMVRLIDEPLPDIKYPSKVADFADLI